MELKTKQYIFTGFVSLLTAAIASYGTIYISDNGRAVQEKTLTSSQTEYLLSQLTTNYQYELKQRKACEEILNPLEQKVRNLEQKIDLLVNQAVTIPFPHWLKSTDGTMLALNTEYERVFLTSKGISKEDYIGRMDSDIWPQEYANKFNAIDKTVSSTGGVWIGQEWVIINDSAQLWQIVKYPAMVGSAVVGVGGFAIPPKNSIYFPVFGDPLKPDEQDPVRRQIRQKLNL